MNRATVLMALFAAFIFPITLSSCGEQSAEKVDDGMPKDAESSALASIVQMEHLVQCLWTVKDLESAKEALPKLEQLGQGLALLKEHSEQFGGEAKLKEITYADPKLKARFENINVGMGIKMMELKKNQPEVARLINATMSKILK